MPKHTHTWRSQWILPVGIHTYDGWMPLLLSLRCACGLSGTWYGEEHSGLQQRRVHAGERDV
jgi:hypothetical protein